MAKQIQSLERGLFILEAILFSRKPVTGLEMASRLGVHKSTISHLTSTLMEKGYLDKEPGTSRLLPGPNAFRLARALMPSVELIAVSRKWIEWLSSQTGETSHIAELRGRHVMFLDNSYPDTALRVQTETGTIQAAHSTAVGKALLSGLSEDEIRSMYAHQVLEVYTEKTIKTVDALLKELGKVREAGVAFDLEEQTLGTGCIAVPILGERGMVIASVGISGPQERVAALRDGHVKSLIHCAGKISGEFALITRGTASRKQNKSASLKTGEAKAKSK